MIHFKTVSDRAILPYLNDLARLRISVFREFPYLYEGNLEYEKAYLQHYARSEGAVVVLALDGDVVVGASTGLPLRFEPAAVQQAWLDNGFLPDEIFYYGESILQRAYRGQGIGVRFFEERERWARQWGTFKIATFCAVIRPENHPRRPADYVPLDDFWKKRGFQKTDNFICKMSWQDLDESTESEKSLLFWWKNI